jgi:SM-20-related protein
LQTAFDCLIDSFITDQVGVAENFLTLKLAASLKVNLQDLFQKEQFHKAGIGDSDHLNHDKQLRSDQIYWLDRLHNNQFENQFFDLIDHFVSYLNSTCFTGITGYEFHYAFYEKGSFYKKHLDQFRTSSSRAFSMIIYLNSEWKIADGGQLCVFHDNHTQLISPQNAKCVFFKSSELEHEVLLTNEPRLSITGWLKVN